MEIIGKIKTKFEEQVITASFKKREFVITTNEQYPQDILIEFTQDKCDLLNKYQVGQEVKVSINIRGREWINPEGVAKYFNTLQAWKIDYNNGRNTENPTTSTPQAGKNHQESEDDLPF